jgi:hypothetical protein
MTEALSVFILLLIPVWFGLSVFKLVQLQRVLKRDIDIDDRRDAQRKRILAIVSLLLSASAIAFFIYLFIRMSAIQC